MLLHFQTRRFFCRLAFVVGCAIPTAGVLAWGGWIQLPAHRDARAAELSRTLGLPVRLHAVSYPQPGVTQYDHLALYDPGQQQAWLRAERVEVAVHGKGWGCILTRPAIEAASLPRLLQLLAAQLEQGPPPDSPSGDASLNLRLHAAELTLCWTDRTETLTNLDVSLGTIDGNRAADLQFRVRGIDMPQPIQARWFYGRDASGLQLNTGAAALPVWIAALVHPGWRFLGEPAAFSGRLEAEKRGDGWQGQATGTLTGLQLNRLLTGRFQHRLDGPAEVRLKHFRFTQNRLESMAGTLTAGPGFISRSLVAEAVNTLRLTFGDPARSAEEILPYDHLGFHFALDATGLQFEGNCSTGPEGAIALVNGQLLLGNSPEGPQPLTSLVRALWPAGDALVPANRQSAWLLQVLPLSR